MTKLCIFDLDGTVLDTLGTIAYYANGALVKHGIAPFEKDEYKYLVGRGATNLVHGMLRKRDCDGEALFARVFEDYNAAYNKNTSYLTEVYAGMRETLDALKEKGIKLALVSNKPNVAVRGVLGEFFPEGYFDFAVGQREGVPIKPDPTSVFEAMEHLGIDASDCVYVGDTGVDMQTGRRAGIFTVGVLWGFREREELIREGADALVEQARELFLYV